MLEFEENEVKCALHMNAKDGYVVLPIHEYNRLLQKAEATDTAITLHRSDWRRGAPIEASIDKHWLYRMLIDKLYQQYAVDDLKEYAVARRADDLLVLDITLATRKPDEPEEASDE